MTTNRSTVTLLFVLVCSHVAPAITIEMVPVGNPGNAGDVQLLGTFGSVAYAYQIGKYEVTAGQYTEFLNAVAKDDSNGLYDTVMGLGSFGPNIQRTGSSPNCSYSVASDWANRPVNYVTFWDAARFANWLHNGQPTGAQGPGTTEAGAYHNVGNQALFGRNAGARFFIPTEDEWYKAAYHKNDGITGNYWRYPTASDTEPINTLPDPGSHANFRDVFGTGNSNYTIGSPYYRTEVGAFANSAGPYGTFDQGGNVAEWNETAVTGSSRGQRGGYFGGSAPALLASNRLSFDPATGNFPAGFRVASAIPEPSTLLLLCFGTLAVLWRRRDRNMAAHVVSHEARDAKSWTLRILSRSISPKSRSPVRKASARWLIAVAKWIASGVLSLPAARSSAAVCAVAGVTGTVKI